MRHSPRLPTSDLNTSWDLNACEPPISVDPQLPMCDPNTSCDLDGFGPDRFAFESPPPGMELPKNPYTAIRTKGNFPPLPSLRLAPALPRIDLEPSSVEFIEAIPNGLYENAPSGVFRVNIANIGECLLKVFHGFVNKQKGRGFRREIKAYKALLHRGVCAAGVVPHCYGWTIMDQTQWNIPGKHDWLLPFRADPASPRALVLEFIPNASKMTLRWTTPQTVENTMTGLAMIHQAGIIREDIHPRNILVVPEGRVIWVDFELASVLPRNLDVTPEGFNDELAITWCWLYQKLLPWKWYVLRRSYEQKGDQEDRIQMEAIKQVLVRYGSKIYV